MSGVGFRIESLWAYLAVHSDNDEGVVGFYGGEGWVPAVAADKKRVDALRPMMGNLARAGKKEIVLVQFTARVDHETIQ